MPRRELLQSHSLDQLESWLSKEGVEIEVFRKDTSSVWELNSGREPVAIEATEYGKVFVIYPYHIEKYRDLEKSLSKAGIFFREENDGGADFQRTNHPDF